MDREHQSSQPPGSTTGTVPATDEQAQPAQAKPAQAKPATGARRDAEPADNAPDINQSASVARQGLAGGR